MAKLFVFVIFALIALTLAQFGYGGGGQQGAYGGHQNGHSHFVFKHGQQSDLNGQQYQDYEGHGQQGYGHNQRGSGHDYGSHTGYKQRGY